MKEDQLLEKLVDLARSLDFDVRFDRGSFRDGSCRVEDRNIVVLNRSSSISRKVNALTEALSELSLDDIFLLPAVREVIEKAKVNCSQPSPRRQHE